MNLINKDFVTPTDRLMVGFKIKKDSPLHLARVYLAAEREALNQLNLRSDDIPSRVLESKVINVLCRWVSDKVDSSIKLGR